VVLRAHGSTGLSGALLLAVLWLSVLLPGHWYGWAVERSFVAFVVVAGIAGLTLAPMRLPVSTGARILLLVLPVTGLFYALSYFVAVAGLGLETGPRDFFELSRYFVLFLFVAWAVSVWSAGITRAVQAVIGTALVLSAVVAVTYAIPVPGLTPLFRDVVYGGTKTVLSPGGLIRLSVPFENPNFLGYFLVLVLVHELFFRRARAAAWMVPLALTLVGMTGSRTSWGAAVAVMGIWIACVGVDRLRGARRASLRAQAVIGALSTVSVLVTFRVLAESHRVNELMERVTQGTVREDPSLLGHVEYARVAWETFRAHPLLGVGPSKYAVLEFVDSQYLSVLLRNGIVGAVLLGAGGVGVLALLWRTAGRDVFHRAGVLAYAAGMATMWLTGAFLDNFRLAFFTGFALLASADIMQSGDSRGRRTDGAGTC